MMRKIVICVGRSGSGKTAVISRVFGPAEPRRITIDRTGECRRLYPHATHVHGARAAQAVLRAWLAQSLMQWHLVVGCDDGDAERIVQALCPIFDGAARSLSELWGGIALECSELDTLLPNGSAPPAWRTAFLRGRHVGLTILGATQYPALVDRVSTSQATTIVTFALHEPRQLAWMRDLGGARFAELVRQLPRYHSMWVHVVPELRIEYRDAEYRVAAEWGAGEIDGAPDLAALAPYSHHGA